MRESIGAIIFHYSQSVIQCLCVYSSTHPQVYQSLRGTHMYAVEGIPDLETIHINYIL